MHQSVYLSMYLSVYLSMYLSIYIGNSKIPFFPRRIHRPQTCDPGARQVRAWPKTHKSAQTLTLSPTLRLCMPGNPNPNAVRYLAIRSSQP
ncbi:hypothetical protein T492DRAFT_1108673 [Pavlovales sp. CCMP2436]|nr:hypothetical protein T492DRAFT_1108673 [Pavlovales sp. CCMP2436]